MTTPENTDNKEVLRCTNCDAPVLKTAGSCGVCKLPLTGREVMYVIYRADKVMIKPLLLQLIVVWSVGLLFFNLGNNGLLLIGGILISAFYGWKIFKRIV